MSWSAGPAAPERKYGAGWSETGTSTRSVRKGGWFALLEKVGQLEGGGSLEADCRPKIAIQAPFCGSGALTPELAIRNYRNALLTSEGALDSAAFRIVARAAALSGDGQLAMTANDGLSGIVQIGHAGQLSGSGSLDALVAGGRPVIDGLSADVSGRLLDILLPALAGSGALSAFLLANYLSAAGVSGAGTLAAVLAALYARAAALAGDGTLAATAIGSINKIQLTDLFNRADSTTTLGGSWTNVINAMGINGNAAYPTAANNDAYAYNTTAMPSDDMQVSVVVGTTSGTEVTSTTPASYLPLGANTAGQRAELWFNNGSSLTNWAIKTATTWAGTTASRVSSTLPAPTVAVGDTITVRRVGNVYTALKNGVAVPNLTWTDSGNAVPRDVNHRLVGIGGRQSNIYRRLDSWTADEL